MTDILSSAEEIIGNANDYLSTLGITIPTGATELTNEQKSAVVSKAYEKYGRNIMKAEGYDNFEAISQDSDLYNSILADIDEDWARYATTEQ